MINLKKLLVLTLTISLSLQAERIVQLKKTVQVSGHLVLLKDLLVATDALKDSEKELIIIKSPLRGSKNYTPEQLAYEMQNHASLMDLALKSPEFIKIMRVKDANYIENVKAGLTAALLKENPWKRFKIEVELTNDDINKINAMSGADFELVSQVPNEMFTSSKLSVKFTEKGKNRGTIILNPNIRRKIYSIVLKAGLSKGAILQKSDLVVDQVWVDGKEGRYASNFIDCVGYELTKDLPSGSRVPKVALMDPIYITKGGHFNAFVVSNGFKVSAVAKALTDGRRGQTIRARNTKSGEIIQVKMVEPKTGIVE